MRRVIIESPYAASDPAELAVNIAYARSAMSDSLARGEAPFVSHLLYTQVLDDELAEERALGLSALMTWRAQAEVTAIYVDLGVSPGMRLGMQQAVEMRHEIVTRRVPGWRQ